LNRHLAEGYSTPVLVNAHKLSGSEVQKKQYKVGPTGKSGRQGPDDRG
jgi:hypothetical protein